MDHTTQIPTGYEADTTGNVAPNYQGRVTRSRTRAGKSNDGPLPKYGGITKKRVTFGIRQLPNKKATREPSAQSGTTSIRTKVSSKPRVRSKTPKGKAKTAARVKVPTPPLEKPPSPEKPPPPRSGSGKSPISVKYVYDPEARILDLGEWRRQQAGQAEPPEPRVLTKRGRQKGGASNASPTETKRGKTPAEPSDYEDTDLDVSLGSYLASDYSDSDINMIKHALHCYNSITTAY